jgi:hypothetical protein
MDVRRSHLYRACQYRTVAEILPIPDGDLNDAAGQGVRRERRDGGAGYPPQPQAPPQQPPPDGRGAGPGPDAAEPVTATVDSSLTVSSCPAGQRAGADDSLIGRDISKVSPQARQRYS